MQLFLYRIQPVHSELLKGEATEYESRVVDEHFSYLKGLKEKGTVLLAGRTTNTDYSSFGIVVLFAETEEIARRTMNEDPAVTNRVFRAELFPFRMALFNSNPPHSL